MQLLDLPPELIHQIAVSLHTQADVSHLAQSSRRLYAEIIDSLYKWNHLFHDSAALVWAALEGVPETLHCARQAGIDATQAVPDLLHIAATAQHGSSELVNRLIQDFGFSDSAYDEFGNTPLACAARAGSLVAARALVDHGADPSQPSINGGTPLHAAAMSKEFTMTWFLLASGARVSPQLTDFVTLDAEQSLPPGTTPLHIAATNNHIGIATLLLDRGADPTMAKLTGGMAPLQIAVRNHRAGMARLLLGRGADVSLTWGFDPGYAVYFAALHADSEMVKVLVEHGSPVCSGGELSCLRAALVNRDADMALYLVDAGADLCIRDLDLVQLAVRQGMPHLAEMIRRRKRMHSVAGGKRSQSCVTGWTGLQRRLRSSLSRWRTAAAARPLSQLAQ